MFVGLDLTQIGLWILYITIPIIAIYLIFSILTRAFRYMGFTTIEAIIIVFVSFLFRFEIIIFDHNISNLYFLSYRNWMLGINMGGAVIPILLSIYLTIKKKIPFKKIFLGILIVTVISFFVTHPVPESGIVSDFPYWLIPSLFASIISIFLLWKDFIKAAPLAYISGTIGVLIGADFLHLPKLLSYSPIKQTPAVIGGAVVFDMIFLT